ncbi:MAG: FAD/NAD(P)-binding protein [Actinocatenispora sp.]
MTRTRPVVVVGGGASGVLTAIALLRSGAAVTLVDGQRRLGAGVAYRTTDPRHLLNSRAGTMSAHEDDPRHFVDWCGNGDRDSFQPRWRYQRYLEDSLRAAAAHGELDQVVGRATAVHPGEDTTVLLADGGTLHASDVVLALGHQQPATPPAVADAGLAGDASYVSDPWAPGALDRLPAGAPVLLLGTGLTAVDAAMSIRRRDPDVAIYAVSRHGLLPTAHGDALPPVPPTFPPPTTARGLLRMVRWAAVEHGAWQPVVDGLRLDAERYWAALPEVERRRFLRHVNRHWQVRRHRMAPIVADTVTAMREAGTLTVLAGRLQAVAPVGRRVEAVIGSPDGPLIVHCGTIVNCTGPGTAATGTDPLVGFLRAAGLARLDALAVGFDVAEDGALLDADGRRSGPLWTIGPLRMGTLWETTAVPEIRAQAAALAHLLTESHALSVI